MASTILLALVLAMTTMAVCHGASCRPTINWTDCAKCPSNQRGACFTVDFNDGGRSDVMCLEKKSEFCIFSGSLLNDRTFVAATGSDLSKCRPFTGDALDVSEWSFFKHVSCTFVLDHDVDRPMQWIIPHWKWGRIQARRAFFRWQRWHCARCAPSGEEPIWTWEARSLKTCYLFMRGSLRLIKAMQTAYYAMASFCVGIELSIYDMIALPDTPRRMHIYHSGGKQCECVFRAVLLPSWNRRFSLESCATLCTGHNGMRVGALSKRLAMGSLRMKHSVSKCNMLTRHAIVHANNSLDLANWHTTANDAAIEGGKQTTVQKLKRPTRWCNRVD